MIPKPNGKQRPLGIPTIEDRLIQQCILQILKPICEAKFHPHSYGFRDNRSAHHALARFGHMINQSQITYVVDIDIKGFFDNVNHKILLKKIWNIGIKDKRVISIIQKLLKAPIEGEGIPNKGTPQGGIISPLLSNIYLNELDWWISSQWETFNTNHKYSSESKKYRALKTTNTKEIWIVRYADDFKLLCRDYPTAKKAYHATEQWLKDRLKLDISPEKSKVVNLKKNYSEFLGFKIKAVKKGNKYVWKSYMCDKAKNKVLRDLKHQIKKIQKCHPANLAREIGRYNSMVLGYQDYYKAATHVNKDFSDIEYKTIKSIQNRLEFLKITKTTEDKTYNKLYGGYKYKIYSYKNRPLYPIGAVKTKPPMNFNQNVCDYTPNGRKLIHDNLKFDITILEYLLKNPNPRESIEYNDNRVGVYLAQNGKCKITKKQLVINEMNFHHTKPRKMGGSDKYSNIVMVIKEVHTLIHATTEDTIKKYLELVKEINSIHNKDKDVNKLIENINKYRLKAGNIPITTELIP